ncbi:S1C family serine protease [Streptomyces sp. NBRC 110028]|uniref:S1C family serine protease n=1 Tax=Streptomyces sp. NBRC 110028 TaxID=1621260 RepID=UPI0006E1D863|nr:trypsin-like peptidase domain-containing protein [Streptomyces sp. NBRC 110028]
MTDSPRRSGDHEPFPYAFGGAAAYPPPPTHEPRTPVTTPSGVTVWPGGGTGDPGGPDGPGGPGGGDTAAIPHPGGGGGRRRRRLSRPAGLIAAVAVVSALVGGGTATLVGQVADRGDTTVSTPVVNAGSSSAGSGVSAVAAAVSPSIVEISATSAQGESTGSGVIVTSGGEIITNNHVVSGADSIKVRFSDGSTKSASVVGTDSGKDLALIKVRGGHGLKAASLGDSSQVKVGDQVVAIGSPEGLTGTVTSGIVSALDRDVTVSTDEGQGQQQDGGGQWPFEFGGGRYNGDVGRSTTTYKAIQTDASLNPGNSGGALINMKGQVIGINSAMYAPASGQSSSTGSIGLGFSIPVDTVKSDLSALRDGGSGGTGNS